MLKFLTPWLACLCAAGSLAAADVVVVEDGITTIAGTAPTAEPTESQVLIGGGQVRIGRLGDASGAQAVRGDDSRLSNPRTAAGGDSDTVGGLSPSQLVQVSQKNQPNGVPGLDANGKIGVAQLPDEALGGGGLELTTTFETVLLDALSNADATYNVIRSGMNLSLPGTFPSYPNLVSMYGNTDHYWMISGEKYTFRNEPSNDESTFHFQSILGFTSQGDDKVKVDFGFHDGVASSETLPSNGAWFSRGQTNTTIRAYTGNNGTRTLHATSFTISADTLYLFRIDFSQHTGARFRIWTDLSGVGSPVYDQITTTNIPQAVARTWRPSLRYYMTTSHTRRLLLAGMGHRVVRSEWQPAPFFTW